MLVRAFIEGELGHFLNAQAKAVDVLAVVERV